jgi:DNA-binding NtrC family response regulator
VRFAAEEGKKISGLSAAASRMLESYDWPGNVRQLENTVFRAVVLCDGNELTTHEFPQIVQHTGVAEDEVDAAPMQSLKPKANHAESGISILGEDGEVLSFAEMEEEIIRRAIEHCKGNLSDVARRLQLGRSTLYRKIKDMGLEESA